MANCDMFLFPIVKIIAIIDKYMILKKKKKNLILTSQRTSVLKSDRIFHNALQNFAMPIELISIIGTGLPKVGW